MKKQIARREFLRVAARNLGMLGLGSALYDTVLIQLLQKAHAQTLKTLSPSGYYIYFSLDGAPPRWLFDLLLTPDGDISSKNFIPGGFGTRIEKDANGKYTSQYHVEKHTVSGKTIYLPPVWKMPVDKPFTNLLPHTVFVRGMNMEINSHPLSRLRQTSPIVGGLSIHGMVGDKSNRPIPAIVDYNSLSASNFKSKKGLATSAVDYKSSNPVDVLLKPFQNYMSNRAVHNPAMAPMQEQVFKEFEKYAEANRLPSTALSKMYDSAIELIENDVYGLSTNWTSTLSKYENLVRIAMQPTKGSLPGLFDKTVKPDGSEKFLVEEGRLLSLDDARDMVTSTTTVQVLAKNFALAELLLDKTTAAMSFKLPSISGVQSGTGIVDITSDQHNVGSIVSTMMSTLYYRALLACMTEYVDVLKTQGLFERTIIHISSEFNRSPKSNGYGSDHGPSGSNCTLISGMIRKNAVIGNIKKDSGSTTHMGTWGVAADYQLGGLNRAIQVNDVALTITSMLGVDNIVTNGRNLLGSDGGGVWAVKLEEAKNV